MTFPRYFTLEEANGLLQWLETKLAQLDPYRGEVARRRRTSGEILEKVKGNGSTHRSDELERHQQLMVELQKSIEDILEQVTSKGIIVRDLERGLVDFPALLEGEEVFLCWLRGEPKVAFWHDINTGFSSRKPL